MKKATAAVGAGVIGVGLGFLLAPSTGKAVRSHIRDKAIKYSREIKEFAEGKSIHLSNKSKGYYHDIRKALGGRIHLATPRLSNDS